jgi:hypothetical protein
MAKSQQPSTGPTRKDPITQTNSRRSSRTPTLMDAGRGTPVGTPPLPRCPLQLEACVFIAQTLTKQHFTGSIPPPNPL